MQNIEELRRDGLFEYGENIRTLGEMVCLCMFRLSADYLRNR
jgi:hypothetical protein